MLSNLFFSQSISSRRLLISLTSIVRYSTSNLSNAKSEKDEEQRDRLATTKKIRLLGLQSNQARQALKIYDDYVNRQKKLPDIRMFAVAINCAQVAKDLAKGREIHQFIERDFPHFKDNLMLKQQLRYFYLKCNDQISADKLFQQSSRTQQNEILTSIDSDQLDKMKIK
jgi:hypothetical protein